MQTEPAAHGDNVTEGVSGSHQARATQCPLLTILFSVIGCADQGALEPQEGSREAWVKRRGGVCTWLPSLPNPLPLTCLPTQVLTFLMQALTEVFNRER